MAYSDDSLKSLIESGKNIAIKGSEQYFEIERYRAVYLTKIGEYNDALSIENQLLNDVKNPLLRRKIELEKCRTLIRSNHLKDAINQCLNIANVAIQQKDTASCVTAYTLLGWANMEIEHYQDAILYLEKGKSLSKNKQYLALNPALLSNLASCYNNIQKPKEAFENIELAIQFAQRSNNLTILANALNIRADMYLISGEKNLAQADMEKALQIREEIGNAYYIMSDLGQLSYFYASTNQTNKGKDAAIRGLEMANQLKSLSKQIYLYGALAENYKVSGDIKNYANSLSKLLDLKDTLGRYNNEEAIANLKNQYELQSKDHMIELQKIELEQHKNFIIGIVVVFTLILLLLVSLYFNYKNLQARKLKLTLEKQEQAIQDAEENERKRIAADLHDNIGAHAGAIKSSIKYLRDGVYNQTDILSQLEQNASEMVNHLNDTIWVLKSEKLLLTNLSDRYKLWMQRLLVNFPDIHYEIKEDITSEIEFSPNNILDLFSSLKEVVTNSIKHSGCSNIHTSITSKNQHWEIVVSDDGKGILLEQLTLGNGLNNLKMRAQSSGWNITWENQNGTVVKIENTI